jgi:HD-GYP domain-containing protein (c-di-GMP phosphodiesterase class II)/DNA-binding CsgD family transcriptional regulator
VRSDAHVPPVRLAELVASLSLGIDIGFAQPMEHVLRQCRIGLRLADLVDVDDTDRAAVYYVALLVNVGCHTDAHEQARWFGDDIAMKATKYEYEPFSAADIAAMLRMLGSGGTPAHRIRVVFDFAVTGRKEIDGMIAGHARMARRLGTELRLPDAALDALGATYEIWNGKGYPGERAGTDIPIASRIVQLAEFMEVAHRTGGVDAALDIARRRAGKQFDPNLVEILCADADKVFHELDDTESWDAVLNAEPALQRLLSPEECDEALTAISRFVDLKSPYTLGHSAAVADLASSAAGALGASEPEQMVVRRAALVARFGCLGVSNGIWDKPRALSAAEWERVRLHPYLTERILRSSPALLPLGEVAVQLRERLDGSGYPRGLSGASITRPARVLAAADVYQAMLEPRPHRAARSPDEAADELRAEARAGRLDGEVVQAVLAVAGHKVTRSAGWPAGLTRREVEVLRLIARGASNKQVAMRLDISPKTAGTHIEHIYAKLGVSSRAEASLAAVHLGLLPERASDPADARIP